MTDSSEENYIITFHFICGKSIEIIYTKHKMDELLKSLAKGWSSCSMIGQECGINFAQVTHYKVKKI